MQLLMMMMTEDYNYIMRHQGIEVWKEVVEKFDDSRYLVYRFSFEKKLIILYSS